MELINNTSKTLKIGFKCNFFSDPFRTFFSNSLLRQFIPELYLKFCTIQTTLAIEPGNVEFSFFFFCLMELINNTSKTLKDDLSVEIKKGSKLSIAAACRAHIPSLLL